MEITPVQQMLSAGSGAILTSLFVTPLDVIKIRMQSQKTNQKCFLYCNGLMDHMCYCVNGNNGVQNLKWYRRPSQFNGTLHGMIHIARKEGITSLWSGLSPTLVMAIPATVMYFTAYDQLKQYFSLRFNSSFVEYAPVFAGAIARGGTVTIVSPLELIRTKMQSTRLSGQEVKAAVQSSIQAAGLRSLWIGLGPTILRDIPFSMIYWYMYEQLKLKVHHSSIYVRSFVCGFCAGITAGLVTLPLDVVKTKRQITLGELEVLGLKAKESTTIYAVMKKIIHESGIRGLFVGIIPRCAKIAPACAIMISTYELGKSFFNERNKGKGISGNDCDCNQRKANKNIPPTEISTNFTSNS